MAYIHTYTRERYNLNLNSIKVIVRDGNEKAKKLSSATSTLSNLNFQRSFRRKKFFRSIRREQRDPGILKEKRKVDVKINQYL